MNSSDNKQFEQRARALYQEAAHSIDPVTAGRLRAARRTALQAAAVRAAPHYRARVLLPVGAVAAVALAALMIWQPSPRPSTQGNAAAAVTEQDNEYLPPGADKADPGLYQNLDFYSWLAANDGSQSKR
jgi:ferric-dicitrate binding protein FerR (iron transport regulator)